MPVPYVIENTKDGERVYDIYSRLLKERIIMVNQEVNRDLAGWVCASLLFLDKEDGSKEINMYINSPGGSVTAGLAIMDTMNLVEADVQTYCMGECSSMGAILLSCGTKGKRFALPNSRVMIHQPLGGFEGQASDMEIRTKEMMGVKDRLNKILAKNTGKSIKQIVKDTDRDNFFSAEEALKYGLIDEILKK